ncbi:MAG TPA: hypothetical protein EYN05_07790 [Nitrospinaceae bacterium]|nr:hypothetical protein [Nitrospinaceae bacterium]
MPVYLFENPETGEAVEVTQRMNDPHVYVDDDGQEWNRVWHIPNAAIDTQIDPHSSKDFVEKTRNKKGTIGDLWDAAKEAGEKRKNMDGDDKIQQKWYKQYSEGRKGLRHMDDPSRGL